MATKKKEESKEQGSKAAAVETQATGTKRETVESLVEAGKFGEAKEMIKRKKLRKDHEEEEIAKIDALEKEVRDKANAKEQAKVDKARPAPKKAKAVTLQDIEDRLYELSSDVDLLTKARAKAGKPNRALMVLKRRLDVLVLQYTKFKKGSRE